MENEQEVPPQETSEKQPAKSSGLSTLLGKIVGGEKEHDFVDLAKTRIIEYKFVGAYDEGFPPSCKVKRWPYGVSITQLPRTVGVIGLILESITSMSSAKRTVEMEINGESVDDIFTILSSKATALKYQEILQIIGSIIHETLVLQKDQKIVVADLEIVDIIGISKIILSQNLGVVLKNLMAAPASVEPKVMPKVEESAS